jgi:hypothetical protein
MFGVTLKAQHWFFRRLLVLKIFRPFYWTFLVRYTIKEYHSIQI